MSPEAQDKAIGEFCKWTCINTTGLYPVGLNPTKPNPAVNKVDRLPNYTGDLNAMHEAEKALNDTQAAAYAHCLAMIVSHGFRGFSFCHASAAEKAEAFLRTIGKWEETQA